MSVGGINFSGLSSGLDTASIISKYVSIAKQPELIYQAQQKTLLDQETVYKTITADLILLQGASQNLNGYNSFNVVTANSSDQTIVTGTASPGAQTGNYNLVVNNLATAQVLTSAAQSSQTTSLGYSGQFLVNGKAITVKATDSLQDIASAINGAQPGATASIIQPTSGKFYLTLGSNSTGVQGKISLTDTNGSSTLQSLGFLSSTGPTIQNPIGTTGVSSGLFSDASTSVGTLLGLTTPTSGTITVAGQAINIDLAHDSLAAISSKINAAGVPGVSAQVVASTDPVSGTTKQQLQINGTQSFTDANGVLSDLGVFATQLAAGSQTTAAQDASFTLNGLTASRPTNSFSDAISGVTVNLVKAGSATLSVAADTATIKTNINNYVTAFNKVISDIQSQSTYDASTNTAGLLLGDGTTQNLVDSLTQGVTDVVPNLSSSTNSLAAIGITLGQDGTLSVNDDTLSSALTNNLSDVSKIFRATGTATNSAVTFVSSTSDTKTSGTAGYAVNITQPATQATYTAGTAQTGLLSQDETLSFGGALFGTTDATPFLNGHTIQLSAGSSLQDVVNTINGDSVISAQLTASIVSGKLTLTSKNYGSTSEFYVASGVADQKDGTSSGIGNAAQKTTGQDVAGTINGELATGVGQYLTGSQTSTSTLPSGKTAGTNGQALGLQLLVTATTAGSYGNIVTSTGVAKFADSFVTSETDAYSGALTNAANSLQTQYDDLTTTLTTLDAQITDYQNYLQEQFNNLETVVGQLKATSSSLTALTNSSTTSSSSTTGTSNSSSSSGG